MSSVKLQDARSKHRNLLHFCTLAINHPKMKLRKMIPFIESSKIKNKSVRLVC